MGYKNVAGLRNCNSNKLPSLVFKMSPLFSFGPQVVIGVEGDELVEFSGQRLQVRLPLAESVKRIWQKFGNEVGRWLGTFFDVNFDPVVLKRVKVALVDRPFYGKSNNTQKISI